MNLGIAADVNDGGEIDREEFAKIMNFRQTTPDERRATTPRDREAPRAAEEARTVAQMLGEYGVRGAGSSGKSERDGRSGRGAGREGAPPATLTAVGGEPNSRVAELDQRDGPGRVEDRQGGGPARSGPGHHGDGTADMFQNGQRQTKVEETALRNFRSSSASSPVSSIPACSSATASINESIRRRAPPAVRRGRRRFSRGRHHP